MYSKPIHNKYVLMLNYCVSIFFCFIQILHSSKASLKICRIDVENPTYRIFVDTKYFSNTLNISDVDETTDFYSANNNFENCVMNNSFNSDVVSQISVSFVERRIYFNLVDDADGSVPYPRPVVIGSIFKNKTTCSMCYFKQDQQNEKIDNGHLITCQCLRHLLLFSLTASLFTEPIPIELNEGDPFILTINFDSLNFVNRMRLKWYHTFLRVSPENERYVTDLISSKVVPCKRASCSNTFNVGYARANDSGEYVAKLFTIDEYEYEAAQATYNVRVFAYTSTPVIKVTDPLTNEVKREDNLKYNVVYRFTCSSTSFPYPSLKMSWSSQCNDSNRRVEDVMNNTKSVTGTFETILYFESTPLFGGLLTCTEKDEWKSELYLTVTDLTDSIILVNFLQTNETFMEERANDIYSAISSTNVTLILSLQKKVKKLKCVWDGDGCPSGSVFNYSERDNIKCFVLVEAEARNVSTCLGFQNDWKIINEHNKVVEIKFDETSLYSNKIYIHINNFSQILPMGKYLCNYQMYNYSFWYDLTMDMNRVNVRPYIYSGPNEESAMFVHYNETIQFKCKGYGRYKMVLFWTHNKQPINNEPYHILTNYDYPYQYSNLSIRVNGVNDSGEYCCMLSNDIAVDNSCVSIYYFPTNYVSLDNLQRIVFSTLAITTILLIMFTPGTFIQRIARNKKLIVEQILLSLNEPTQMEEIVRAEENVQIEMNQTVNVADGNTQTQKNQIDLNSTLDIPMECIEFSSELGRGNFGKVFKARIKGIKADVAVKTEKEKNNSEQIEILLNEFKFMLCVGHHENILSLVGVCKDHLPNDFYIFVEYCPHGALDDYLYKCRGSFVDECLQTSNVITLNSVEIYNQMFHEPTEFPSPKVTTTNLLSYSSQIANGMKFLESKRIVHRDLALRNLLLNKDQQIKICDFGLSRNSYYYMKLKEQPLPFKWMALETILDRRKFSSKSDVWSFGIVLWEMFSLAEEPYSDQPFDASLIQWLRNGNRLDCPRYSPESIYNLMKDCWNAIPEDRPDFQQCKIRIENTLNEFLPNIECNSTHSDFSHFPSPNKFGYARFL